MQVLKEGGEGRRKGKEGEEEGVGKHGANSSSVVYF